MNPITQCPECGTRFNVTVAQLDAHDGLVRCGRCHDVFNAREHLHDNEPSPQMSLPIDLELADTALKPDNTRNDPAEEFATLAQQVQFVDELTDEVQSASAHPWLTTIAILTLTLALAAQSLYYFRVEIAARLPGTKPLLVQYCTLLSCSVPLPQKVELIAIESSQLESDSKQGNIITLHVLIHNSASYAQAFPSLELTLTDTQDHALASRVYRPRDYLKPGEDELLGVPANRDLDIKLHLDTTDLKPSGYRLFLYYPK